MGEKRKNTADGNTPTSKSRLGHKLEVPAPAVNPAVVEAPPAMGLPGLKPTTQPAPVPVPSAVAGEAPPPPESMVALAHHQPEDGGRLLELARGAVAVSAAEEEVVRLLDSDVPKTVLRCDECHGSVKPPVYQCSLLRHVACSDCGAGERRPCAGCGADAAFYVQSSYLDTLFGFGCASSVAYRDVAAHAAACACAPCRCDNLNCSFEGTPPELLSHLADKAGRHRWATNKITYGKDFGVVVRVAGELKGCVGPLLLVAKDDSRLFLLAVGYWSSVPRVTLVCVRGTSAGPVYTSSITVEGPPAEGRSLTLRRNVVRSCSALNKFDLEAEPECDCVFVYPEMLHGKKKKHKKIHLRICIGKA